MAVAHTNSKPASTTGRKSPAERVSPTATSKKSDSRGGASSKRSAQGGEKSTTPGGK